MHIIVVFFGFFHGFAHGQEMPASASLMSFALGFMMATIFSSSTAYYAIVKNTAIQAGA
ncbi:MAG: HupE/UreJ family protein [Methylococcales bacterium]|nr:HupE/UreJ family protein [Methylococcales bacterium]